mmetsp:Transcript_13710/g.22287  ORF Transcript_13710/g.22287 Transcript_13710/m.22287 type:complete len:262 (+) Transcript_13710:682-1467(+)
MSLALATQKNKKTSWQNLCRKAFARLRNSYCTRSLLKPEPREDLGTHCPQLRSSSTRHLLAAPTIQFALQTDSQPRTETARAYNLEFEAHRVACPSFSRLHSLASRCQGHTALGRAGRVQDTLDGHPRRGRKNELRRGFFLSPAQEDFEQLLQVLLPELACLLACFLAWERSHSSLPTSRNCDRTPPLSQTDSRRPASERRIPTQQPCSSPAATSQPTTLCRARGARSLAQAGSAVAPKRVLQSPPPSSSESSLSPQRSNE